MLLSGNISSQSKNSLLAFNLRVNFINWDNQEPTRKKMIDNLQNIVGDFFMLIGTFALFFVLSEILSFINKELLIKKILKNRLMPIYRERIDFDNAPQNSNLPKLILNANYSICKIEQNPMKIVFASNNFFEKEAIIYKLEDDISQNKVLSLYSNRFNIFYGVHYSHKKFKDLFLSVRSNLLVN